VEPDRWHRITGVFHAALALDDAERSRFLDRACAGNPALRAEVEALLSAERRAGSFGSAPLGMSVDAAVATTSKPEGDLESETKRPNAREQWAARCTALVTIAALSWGAASLVLKHDATVGWTEQQRGRWWHVHVIDPDGPASGALQPGDRILALNDVPPAPGPGTRFLRMPLRVGDRYSIAVERNGRRVEAELPTAADPAAWNTRVTYFFICVVWCGIGALIGLARPDRITARLACAAAVATGFSYLSAGVVQTGPFWGPFHVAIGYHFFCWFPSDRRPTRAVRWSMYAMYAVAIPPSILGVWLSWTFVTAGGAAATRLAMHNPLFPLVRAPLSWVVYCAAFLAMPTVMWWNYRRVSDEDARRRVRWVVLSAAAALIPQWWSAAVATSAFFFGPSRLPAFGFPIDVFTIVIPLSVAYVVVRHRVFDITVVVRRGVQYLLARRALQALTAAPLLAVAVTLLVHRDQTISQLAFETRGYLFWSATAAVMLPSRRRVGSWLDRRFFRHAYDREQVLLALVDDVAAVDSIPELSRLLVERIESALHPQAIYFWQRDASGLTLAHSSSSLPAGSRLEACEALVAWLEQSDAVVAVTMPNPALSAGERRWLRSLAVSLAVPVVDNTDRLVGALMLGEKKSEEPYTIRDRRLLEAIAKQAAVVRENLALRAQVSDEQRIRRDVLARIDGGRSVLKECPECGACYDGAVDVCARDASPLTVSLPVPRTIAGRYQLDSLIGKGGMGAVYAGRDTQLHRDIAVKILLAETAGSDVRLRRFEREARAIARLNHPNVVQVYDFGVLDTGAAYLVMERVAGRTLRRELTRAGTLTPHGAAAWFAPLLNGLSAAHESGIVHRDLKPENVVGWGSADRVSVKLLDFGLAKATAAQPPAATVPLTMDGTAVGTSGYMSPEQILGRDVDHRSDIFSVGVMVVEAISGRRPFRGSTYAEIARAVLDDDCDVPASCDAGVEAVVRRCLDRDREKRFSSALELREALIPALFSHETGV